MAVSRLDSNNTIQRIYLDRNVAVDDCAITQLSIHIGSPGPHCAVSFQCQRMLIPACNGSNAGKGWYLNSNCVWVRIDSSYSKCTKSIVSPTPDCTIAFQSHAMAISYCNCTNSC